MNIQERAEHILKHSNYGWLNMNPIEKYMKHTAEQHIRDVVRENLNVTGGTIDYSDLEKGDVMRGAKDLTDDEELFGLLEAQYARLIYRFFDEVQEAEKAEWADERAARRTEESMKL